jgi:HEAT repeat protein
LTEALENPVEGERVFDGSPRVRISRLLELLATQLGPRAHSAVPALSRALSDTDGRVRSNAVNALRRIGSPSKPSVPALAEALRQEISPGDPGAAKTWGGALLIGELIFTLESLGPDAKDALPVLLPIAGNQQHRHQRQAAAAVRAISPQTAADDG